MQAVRAWGFGAEGGVRSAHVSHAAQRTVVGDDRGNVYYLDGQGSVLWRQNVSAPILEVRTTADAKAVFVLTAGEILRFSYKGRVLWRHTLPAPGTALDVRSSSQTVVVGCGDLARIFSGTGAAVGSFRVRHFIHSVRIAAGSGAIVVGSDRGQLTYLDREGHALWETGINAWSGGVEQDGNGSLVLLPGGASGVYSFDGTGAPRGIYDIGGAVRAVAVDEHARRLILAGFDGLLRLMAVDNGTTLWSAPARGEVIGLDIDPSGDRAAVVTKTDLTLLDFVGADEDRGDFLEVSATRAQPKSGPTVEWAVNLRDGPHGGPVSFAEIAIAAHGEGAVVLQPDDRSIRGFNGRGQEIWTDRAPLGDGGEGRLRMVSAPHGNLIAFGGIGGLLLATFDRGRVSAFNVMVRTLSVSDVGNAVLAGDLQDRLHLFDAHASETWTTATDGFQTAQLSPRGNAIGIARADGILRFYQRDGRAGWQMDLTPGPAAGFGPSEIHIAAVEEGVAYAVADGTVGLRTPSGEALWERTLSDRPVEIELVGRTLAVTDVHDTVHLFKLTGDPIRDLPPREGVSILAEGGVERLLEFHYNGSEINCFDVERGTALWRRSMPARVTALARSGCGEYLGVLAGAELLLLRLGGVSRTEDSGETDATETGTQGCFLEI